VLYFQLFLRQANLCSQVERETEYLLKDNYVNEELTSLIGDKSISIILASGEHGSAFTMSAHCSHSCQSCNSWREWEWEVTGRCTEQCGTELRLP